MSATDIRPDDRASNEWLNAQKKLSKYTYKYFWKFFIEYTGLTGDQILADRQGDGEYRWEKKTLDFKQWMITEKRQSENSARTAGTTVRSFFGYHRTPLVFRRSEKAKLVEAKRKTEDYRFSRDDLRAMAGFGDPVEEYIIVAGKSFGLRAGDFLNLRRGDLEAYIDREPPISIGEYHTKKEGVSAYPFIDVDAKPVIRKMLSLMDQKNRKKPSDRVLTFDDERPLTDALKRTADMAGISYGNKKVRFHCLRKFLVDRLSSYMSESKWKQIVGKKISEGAYISPDSLREDYLRAMSETAFTKPEGDIELLAKKQALLMMLKLQGITEKDVEAMFTPRRRMMRRSQLTLREEVEVLEKAAMKNSKGRAKKCEDGEHCQKVITEEELPSLLAQGWRVVATLPSGKIVVSDD